MAERAYCTYRDPRGCSQPLVTRSSDRCTILASAGAHTYVIGTCMHTQRQIKVKIKPLKRKRKESVEREGEMEGKGRKERFIHDLTMIGSS